MALFFLLLVSASCTPDPSDAPACSDGASAFGMWDTCNASSGRLGPGSAAQITENTQPHPFPRSVPAARSLRSRSPADSDPALLPADMVHMLIMFPLPMSMENAMPADQQAGRTEQNAGEEQDVRDVALHLLTGEQKRIYSHEKQTSALLRQWAQNVYLYKRCFPDSSSHLSLFFTPLLF